MKTKVLSLTSATVLFASLAHADDMKKFTITQPDAFIAPMAIVNETIESKDLRSARLAAIESVNGSIASVASAFGVKVNAQLKTLGAISFAEMSEAQANDLRQLGYVVESAEQEYYLVDQVHEPFEGVIVEKDFDYSIQALPYGITTVRADETWADADGSGVRLCVIDTGMDLDHPDLASNYTTGIRTIGSGGPGDQNGHGTHVAGTAAGNLNGNDITGVAPNADIYVSAVFEGRSTTTQAILEGLDWCVQQNAQVANMSYGGGSSTSSTESAYNAAYNSGLVMVAATGNSGTSSLSYPARYSSTIAVGGTDSSDRLYSGSQRGPEIDITAPAVGVVSARNGGGTVALTGTSMATPHVAGAAAVLLSADPSLSIEEVRSTLRNSSVDLGASGFDTSFGAGRLDVRAAYDSLGGGGGNPDPNPGDQLVVTNISGSVQGDVALYTFSVPSGQSSVSFQLTGNNGDADLYVGYNSPPTYGSTGNYVCREVSTGSNEFCSISNPSSGTYYIAVRVWQAFSGVTLIAEYD
ncbi:MAG: S8 family serine peptidase [Pseudomonadota bacterium]